MLFVSLYGFLKGLLIFRPLFIWLFDFYIAGSRNFHMLTRFLFLLSLFVNLWLFQWGIYNQVAIFNYKHQAYTTVVIVVVTEKLIAFLFWYL